MSLMHLSTSPVDNCYRIMSVNCCKFRKNTRYMQGCGSCTLHCDCRIYLAKCTAQYSVVLLIYLFCVYNVLCRSVPFPFCPIFILSIQ